MKRLAESLLDISCASVALTHGRPDGAARPASSTKHAGMPAGQAYRLRQVLFGTTALVAVALAGVVVVVTTTPVLADGGSGSAGEGQGGGGGGGSGGTGGKDNQTSQGDTGVPGGNGAYNYNGAGGGGGGGGAGTTGGTGGFGGGPKDTPTGGGTGGAGGGASTNASGSYYKGGNGFPGNPGIGGGGGGGGGGGAHGYVGNTLPGGTIQGGYGGTGGKGSKLGVDEGGANGGSGGGGAGGWGAVVTGSSGGIYTNYTIRGGRGGDGGGDDDVGAYVSGGNGGTGGVGLYVNGASQATLGSYTRIYGGGGGHGGSTGQDAKNNTPTGSGGVGGDGFVAVGVGQVAIGADRLYGGNGGQGGAFGLKSNGGAGGRGAVILGGISTNSGTIKGGNGGYSGPDNAVGSGGDGGTGVFLDGDSARFTNNSTITGGNGAGGKGAPDVAHSGRGGTGLYVSRGVAINKGAIRGGEGGDGHAYGASGGGGGAGAYLKNGGTLINSGTISAGYGGEGQGGSLGGGGNGGTGVLITGGTLINNSSTIAGANGGGGGDGGAGGDGVSVNGGTVTNNSATIKGGNGNGSGVGGYGVSVTNGTLTNHGTINGGSGGSSALGGSGVSVNNGIVINSGTMTGGQDFSNSGDFAPGLTITGGTNRLELWAGSNIEFLSVKGGNNTLALGGSTDATFDASLIPFTYQGFQVFEKTGSSIWTLTCTTLSCPTDSVTPWTINQGVLQISSDDMLGDVSGVLTFDGGGLRNTATMTMEREIQLSANGGVLDANAAELTVAGVIAGEGALFINGEAAVILTNTNNNYTGGTVIEGILEVSSDAVLGDVSGDLILDGGKLVAATGFATARDIALRSGGGFFQTIEDPLTASGVISGAGSLNVSSGTLILTGKNSYTGGTVIDDGTLQIGDGGTSGSVNGDVTNNGALAFNRSNSYRFDGVISGAGEVIQAGTGTLVLNGDSTYTGGTTVEIGNLVVDGSLAGTGSLTVELGVVGGFGTLPETTVSGGGAMTVGSPNFTTVGTITVQGDLTFESGAIYHVDVRSPTKGDKTVVSGTANLAGNVTVAADTRHDYKNMQPLTILSASEGLNGTFDGVFTNSTFLKARLTYPNDDEVRLKLWKKKFTSAALTRNHFAVARALDEGDASDAIRAAVFGQATDPAARAAFDQLSGETIQASAATALIEDSDFVRDVVMERLRAAFDGAAAPTMAVMPFGPEEAQGDGPGADPRFAVWGTAFGGFGDNDGDGNAAALDRSTAGFLAGGDMLVTQNWRFGLFGGYSRSSFDADERNASGDSDNIHLGAYGGTQWGPLGLRFGAAYAWQDVETSRNVAFDGFADGLTASYDASTAQLFGEAGYRIETAAASFEPFAGLAYVNVDTDGFAEEGGAAALSGDGGSNDVTYTTLGLRAATGFALGSMRARANGAVGWRHAFGDVTPVATYNFAGSPSFTVAGTPIAEDALVLEAGLDLDLNERATFGVSYDGQIGDGAKDHAFSGTLTVRF